VLDLPLYFCFKNRFLGSHGGGSTRKSIVVVELWMYGIAT
jgi:hypothetical protein